MRISDLVLIIRGVCAFLTLAGFSYFPQYIFPSSLTSALLITTPLVPILTYIIIGRFNFACSIVSFSGDFSYLKYVLFFIFLDLSAARRLDCNER